MSCLGGGGNHSAGQGEIRPVAAESMNLDQTSVDISQAWLMIDVFAYGDYRVTLVRLPNSPDILLWEIFLEVRESRDLHS